MADIIVFPRSPNAYRGPFTHPELEGMQRELYVVGGLSVKVENDLAAIQSTISDQARWLIIRHLEFALAMTSYVDDPELLSQLKLASEKSQYKDAVQ